MIHQVLNGVKSLAQQALAGRSASKHATVTNYDPHSHAVKVLIQPGAVPTGWIPLKSPWVGNGWGLYCPPSVGDAVELSFQEDDVSAASVGWRFFNDVERPLPCPSGEFWLVHASGSTLRFHNDGSVELISAGDVNATVGGSLNAMVAGHASTTAQGSITQSAPNITLNGAVTINGPMTQGKGSQGGAAALRGPLTVANDVTAGGISLQHHTHGGVQNGNGSTGAAQ